eukprot:4982545-Amphidinium_carterae.4
MVIKVSRLRCWCAICSCVAMCWGCSLVAACMLVLCVDAADALMEGSVCGCSWSCHAWSWRALAPVEFSWLGNSGGGCDPEPSACGCSAAEEVVLVSEAGGWERALRSVFPSGVPTVADAGCTACVSLRYGRETKGRELCLRRGCLQVRCWEGGCHGAGKGVAAGLVGYLMQSGCGDVAEWYVPYLSGVGIAHLWLLDWTGV